MIDVSDILDDEEFAVNMKLLQSKSINIDGDTGLEESSKDIITDIVGSFQPTNGRAPTFLKEGEQISSTYTCYISNELNPSIARVGKFRTGKDRIEFEGQIYLIMSARDFRQHGHTELVCILKDNQESKGYPNQKETHNYNAKQFDELGREV